MKRDLNQYMLLFAGLMNIFGTLIFTKFFTNTVLTAADPFVMNTFSLFMLLAWGLAMIVVSKSYALIPQLIGVFALEKIIYAVLWLYWILNNDLTDVFKEDMLTGIFYASYGPLDSFFAFFFSALYFKLRKK
jgi:hypothetical protein